MSMLGKILILFGIVFILLGIFLIFFQRIPYLGKLPGDIIIRRGNTVIYFPIVTCILLSIIFSLILNIFFRR
ncbi:MAG TPA: DUF2905 domain-containing protein [bacterium]|nr:DUF2905 domain-containing protein [Dictyoglomota bacterium]HHV81706.1 DUF2905 domain-containing protein [bacterium]HOK30257.1 DUF2905 domain-containing protein [bacterium]HPO82406.1 DUF2905 domain-containing protein [bacterium]HRR91114.1 DUF2905 domain-containing protein [bacterium]